MQQLSRNRRHPGPRERLICSAILYGGHPVLHVGPPDRAGSHVGRVVQPVAPLVKLRRLPNSSSGLRPGSAPPANTTSWGHVRGFHHHHLVQDAPVRRLAENALPIGDVPCLHVGSPDRARSHVRRVVQPVAPLLKLRHGLYTIVIGARRRPFHHVGRPAGPGSHVGRVVQPVTPLLKLRQRLYAIFVGARRRPCLHVGPPDGPGSHIGRVVQPVAPLLKLRHRLYVVREPPIGHVGPANRAGGELGGLEQPLPPLVEVRRGTGSCRSLTPWQGIPSHIALRLRLDPSATWAALRTLPASHVRRVYRAGGGPVGGLEHPGVAPRVPLGRGPHIAARQRSPDGCCLIVPAAHIRSPHRPRCHVQPVHQPFPCRAPLGGLPRTVVLQRAVMVHHEQSSGSCHADGRGSRSRQSLPGRVPL
mmetsp:Transcript_29193/g.82354  ORF Transcript_29193/g.82354 Transcript_29193/m.82354 type:complete len:418 (+) Transcript_29193:2083-3336(+)